MAIGGRTQADVKTIVLSHFVAAGGRLDRYLRIKSK
jgi:hypothetical protein